MNLLEALVLTLASVDCSLDSITWIGNNEGVMDLNLFFNIARSITSVEFVPGKLYIVCNGFWIEKTNYDDDSLHEMSECLSIKSFPKKSNINNNNWISYFDENEKTVLKSYGIDEGERNETFIIKP